MKLNEIIKLLKKHKPRTAEKARAIGIRLRTVSSGAFRNVYRVAGEPYVIKFPYGNPPSAIDEAIAHANKEVKVVKQLSRFSVVRRILPEIYFHDAETGVVLMKYYKKNKEPLSCHLDDALHLICNLINAVTKHNIGLSDLHSSNVMFTPNGIKLLDLGYSESDFS